jgi:D-threonine aldolase
MNIALIKTMIEDVNRLRPHVKTHKCRETTLMMLEAGISKFKCATIAEGEMLAMAGAKDILLAYQPIGPKLTRFIHLIEQYPATKFSCLIDNIEVAKQISTEAIASGIHITTYVDLNVGMNRTGIQPHKALELFKQSTNLKGIRIAGLHVYDGHIHDENLDVRTEQTNEVLESINIIRKQLADNGFNDPIVIAGGSPTFPVYARQKEIECSPGTFIYWDAGYEQAFKEQPFLPAAILITRIISLPDDETICTDLGHKSVSAENVLHKRFKIMNGSGLEPKGQNEEHLMLHVIKGHSYKIGDVLYLMPFHICPTCALYERGIIVKNGIADGEWKIVGRDRKINL